MFQILEVHLFLLSSNLCYSGRCELQREEALGINCISKTLGEVQKDNFTTFSVLRFSHHVPASDYHRASYPSVFRLSACGKLKLIVLLEKVPLNTCPGRLISACLYIYIYIFLKNRWSVQAYVV